MTLLRRWVKIDQLTLVLISAVITASFSAIGIYIGFTKGSAKTVDIALDKIEKRSKESPTIKRIMKVMEMIDKLFGDKQAVEQMTRFFKEAGDLVSSKEAKNFFKNVSSLMKELGGSKKKRLKLPKKDR